MVRTYGAQKRRMSDRATPSGRYAHGAAPNDNALTSTWKTVRVRGMGDSEARGHRSPHYGAGCISASGGGNRKLEEAKRSDLLE